MTNGQYTASLSIFFVSYALFEPLTNILLKRFRPSVFLPATMVVWGICMVCMGLVHNFAGLATARWFLGVAEVSEICLPGCEMGLTVSIKAGLFPGVNYYLSCW